MSIRQFQQDLKKGLPDPVYLIYSPEEFLLYEALSLVRQSQGGLDVFNFEVFDADSPDSPLTMEQVLDAVDTLPMMAPRRTVVVRNVQDLPKKDLRKLDPYLNKPSQTTLLVMLFSGKPSKGFELLGHPGVRALPLFMPESELPRWVKAKAALLGKSISDAAVRLLIESVGTDLGLLHSEIQKLASSDSPSIDVGAVKAVVYAGIEYSGFDLVNALMKGDRGEVFRIYLKLGRAIEPQLLIGALNWQFSRHWAGRQQNRKEARKKFSMVFRLLHEADLALKTSHEQVLEDLLVKLLKIRL